MPMVETASCAIRGASESDVSQWCSHHLSNRFTIHTNQRWAAGKLVDFVIVNVLGTKDRFRLRDAYDIAETRFGEVFAKEGSFIDK